MLIATEKVGNMVDEKIDDNAKIGGVTSERFSEIVKLFDFYSPVLSVKQREALDLHYNEDLSLSEIAELMNITRQGVGEAIRAGQKRLFEFEEKLGAIRTIEDYKTLLERIVERTENGLPLDLSEIKRAADIE